ncbi:hypothetical protein APTSU1_001117700 [Apodemus speciosus]|uniref:Uncharacterized protein n=1 Tax=Apodemus speciosus TaxID=105296 RepID=A0ABQ0F9P3_APOSI
MSTVKRLQSVFQYGCRRLRSDGLHRRYSSFPVDRW